MKRKQELSRNSIMGMFNLIGTESKMPERNRGGFPLDDGPQPSKQATVACQPIGTV